LDPRPGLSPPRLNFFFPLCKITFVFFFETSETPHPFVFFFWRPCVGHCLLAIQEECFGDSLCNFDRWPRGLGEVSVSFFWLFFCSPRYCIGLGAFLKFHWRPVQSPFFFFARSRPPREGFLFKKKNLVVFFFSIFCFGTVCFGQKAPLRFRHACFYWSQ